MVVIELSRWVEGSAVRLDPAVVVNALLRVSELRSNDKHANAGRLVRVHVAQVMIVDRVVVPPAELLQHSDI